ncbi:UBX2 UBX domain-containing protein 2 [Candida maltosa Xu316]
MESLAPEHRDKFEDFKSITGISNDTDDEKIAQLLILNDYNLNNAISTYFDSGFDTIGASSAVNVHDEIDNNLTHRHNSNHDNDETPHSRDLMNLQHQMFYDSFLPKLPKAPVISNGWQLEVGIHTSIIEDRLRREEKEKEEKEKEDVREGTESVHSVESSTRKSPISTLWIILLIIPKTLLHVLISAFKFLFGWGSFQLGGNNDYKLRKSFNYEHFIPGYKLLPETFESSVLDSYSVHESDFNDLHQLSQKEYRWLLVVLVNDSESSHNFVKKLVEHPEFDKLFNKENGVYNETDIFVGNVDKSPEAFEIGQTYSVRRTPYIMLVGYVSASPEIMPSMSILYKSNLSKVFITDEELPRTANKIMNNLNKLLDKFNPQLVSARFDKQEMDISRQIRQEQDDAYLRSLHLDKVKKEIKQKEEHAKKMAEQKSKLRQYYLLKLLESNYIETNVLDEQSENKCKIALKLPNGKRIVELFNTEISLLEFYMFIELKLFIDEQDEEEEVTSDTIDLDDDIKESIQDIKDYYSEYSFMFEIIQPYPKKIIHLEEPSYDTALKDIKEFHKGANFLIEFIEDDEDEDDDDDEMDG